MAKSAFSNALAKKVGIQNWKHFTQAEDVFGGCDLPDGVYWTRLVSIRCSDGENSGGEPMVALCFVVVDGEHEGQKPRKTHFLAERGNRTLQMCLEMLSVDMQRLGANVDEIELETLEDVCDKIVATKPRVKIQFANPDNPSWSPDIGILSCETSPWDEDGAKEAFKKEETPEPEQVAEPEPESADDGGDDTAVSSEERNDAMDVIPEVGDLCNVAPTGRGRPSKCTVIEVDEEGEVCTVKRVADKKVFKNVTFARLDFGDDDIPF